MIYSATKYIIYRINFIYLRIGMSVFVDGG